MMEGKCIIIIILSLLLLSSVISTIFFAISAIFFFHKVLTNKTRREVCKRDCDFLFVFITE